VDLTALGWLKGPRIARPRLLGRFCREAAIEKYPRASALGSAQEKSSLKAAPEDFVFGTRPLDPVSHAVAADSLRQLSYGLHIAFSQSACRRKDSHLNIDVIADATGGFDYGVPSQTEFASSQMGSNLPRERVTPVLGRRHQFNPNRHR
jgi:hypothetical protein